jgi:guanine deaminase
MDTDLRWSFSPPPQTTTSCYYASLHLESSQVLADAAHAQGQRAFVGKVRVELSSPLDYFANSSRRAASAT